MKRIERIPWYCFLLAVFALPFERFGAFEAAVGTIRASQLFAFFAILGLLFQLPEALKRLRRLPVLAPLLVFFAIVLLGTPASLNVDRTVAVVLLTAFTALFGLSVPLFITSQERLRTVVTVLLVSAALVSVFGLFQFFGDLVGWPTTVTGLREQYTKDVFGFPRVQSTALEPLYFANFLLLPLGIVFSLFLAQRTRESPWFLGLVALFAVNVVLTVSRGGYLATALTLGVIAIISFRRFMRLRVLLPLAIAAIVVAMLVPRLLQTGDVERTNLDVFTTHIRNVFYGASYNERIETFEAAVDAWRTSPWVGIGLGSFGPFIAQHPLVEPDGGWRIVNNEFLELLAETGVFGFFAFCFFLWLILLTGMRSLSASHPSFRRAVGLGMLAATIGIIAQYQTFSTLYIMHVWFAFGMVFAVNAHD